MDRSGIFVDAGHLLAQGGLLCCGTHRRSEFTCDHVGLIRALIELVHAHSGIPLLRLYWYDGAENFIPSLDHLAIANLPSVKVRLGRVSWGRQKGVDALIYRDLMTLARERAMATAYLLAGDEDLREGVVVAQEMGVRVILLGIQPTKTSNQSEFLIREADEHVVLDKAFCLPHFTPVAAPPLPTQPDAVALNAAREFALRWAASASSGDIGRLVGQAPRIPADLDGQLLKHVQAVWGRLEDRRDLRHQVRESFWDAINNKVKLEPPTTLEGERAL